MKSNTILVKEKGKRREVGNRRVGVNLKERSGSIDEPLICTGRPIVLDVGSLGMLYKAVDENSDGNGYSAILMGSTFFGLVLMPDT